MALLEYIIKVDFFLFRRVNQLWTCGFLDAWLPLFRTPAFWVPLYVFVVFFMFQNNASKQALIWLLCFVCIVSCCDVLSSRVIKQLIFRYRPCLDPYWEGKVRLLVNYCSTRSGFTSSHAMNHFGMGIFLYYTFKEYIKKWALLFLFWAFVVSYSQVYVGLHYPLDIIAGGGIGSGLGFLGWRYYRHILYKNIF